ncbi:MAG TPA: hypothetical protein VFM88_03200 [Vicinamibacteria bacterium]|nr:hypothetical protein [Vicinamibacteria bacterium]
MRAAFGFRSHSGFATLVVATGSLAKGQVLERRRIELVAAGVPRQPYHEAQPLPFAAAEALVGRARAEALRAAQVAVAAALEDARNRGLLVQRAGLLVGSGKRLPPLDKILASHALIHAAEGELYREVLRGACEAAGLRVAPVPEKEVRARGAELLGGKDALERRLVALGRELGAPWREDEKHAALAAWMAAGSGR